MTRPKGKQSPSLRNQRRKGEIALQHAPKLKIIKLNFDTEKDQAKASKATPPLRPKTFDTICNDAEEITV